MTDEPTEPHDAGDTAGETGENDTADDAGDTDTAVETGENDTTGDTGDTVVYDLSEWEPAQVDTLEWALGREGVPGVLRDRELTIRLDHEARVDYLIDHLFDDVAGIELAPVVDDGDADIGEMEAVGELFVAADRLAHAGEDQVVRAQFEEAATVVDSLPLPYGFEVTVWERMRTMAAWLVDELDGAGPDLVEEHAGTLRDLLRQYI
jgi:hypothetical protein